MVGRAQVATRVAIQRFHRQSRTRSKSEPSSAGLALPRRDQDDVIPRKAKAQHRNHRGQESQTKNTLPSLAK